MFLTSNDFKNGIAILLEGEIYIVTDFQHSKTARGPAFVRSKLRNLKTGYILEKTFRAGEKLQRAFIDYKKMQYLYASDDDLVVMDLESFEQFTLPSTLFGDGVKWLKEGMDVTALVFEGRVIGIELPTFVELVVTETEPGFKGDTATGGNKPATMETGATVNVPLFVEIGEKLQIDTRTGTYLKRV
jgi:elongation factor P